jgi:hypothetical protein
LKLDFPNWELVKGRITAKHITTKNRFRDSIRTVTRLLTEYMKVACPIGTYYTLDGTPYQTSKLRNSIRFRTYDRTEFVEARITMADYGIYTLPPGTRPHPIFARRGSMLAFYWAKAGRAVFRTQVSHPGYAGDPWSKRALEAAKPRMEFVWNSIAEGWKLVY